MWCSRQGGEATEEVGKPEMGWWGWRWVEEVRGRCGWGGGGVVGGSKRVRSYRGTLRARTGI